MDFVYADFIGILLLLTIVISVIIDYMKNNKRFNAFQAISIAFALFYGFVPYLVRHFELKPSLLLFDAQTHFVVQLWTYGGYIIFLFTYQITNKISKKNKTLNFDINNIKDNLKKTNTIIKVTHIIFITGLICNFYFYLNMGGIISALSMAESLRGDIEFNSIIYTVPFLSLSRMLMPLISIASFMYLYFLSKGFKKYKLQFVISTIMVVIYVLFNAGKLYLILTITSYLLFIIFKENKRVVIKMCVLAILFLIIIEPLNDLFYFLEYRDIISKPRFGKPFTNYFEEFVFPYSNLLHVKGFVDTSGLRWGYDYIAIIVDILPSSVLSRLGFNEPLPSHIYNTYNHSSGVWIAGTPTDLITLGYYQYREFGIFIICIIWGIICALFDRKLRKFSYERGDFLIRVRALLFFFQLVPYADPSPLWRNRLDYLFFVFLIIYITHKKTQKNLLLNGENCKERM